MTGPRLGRSFATWSDTRARYRARESSRRVDLTRNQGESTGELGVRLNAGQPAMDLAHDGEGNPLGSDGADIEAYGRM